MEAQHEAPEEAAGAEGEHQGQAAEQDEVMDATMTLAKDTPCFGNEVSGHPFEVSNGLDDQGEDA